MKRKDLNLILESPNTAHWNWVKIGMNESTEHKLLKLEVCKFLVVLEQPFLTEVIFKGGSRGDIVAYLLDTVFEVMVSEKESNKIVKEGYYPEEMEIVVISCFDDIKKHFNK